jgi:hypothetical protein
MAMHNEKRLEPRIDQKTTVFVEVCSATFDNSEPASVVICHSLDLSANGLQVEMDQAVAIGTILRICAEFSNGEDPLHLVGETKWVKANGDLFNIGFALYDAENTDIAGWKNVIANMLAVQ